MLIDIDKNDYLPAGSYALSNQEKIKRALENIPAGSDPRAFLLEYDRIGGLITDTIKGEKVPVHTFWNIEQAKTNDSVENLSNDELEAIIRKAENSHISGSRHQRASAEWDLRHKKAMLEAAQSKNRPAFIKVEGDVKGLTARGNTVIGDADFLHSEGSLEKATFENNKHIVSPKDDKGFNWAKWGTVFGGVAIVVSIILWAFPNGN